MRDDVHRRAPVPQRWRTFLKAHRNDASSFSNGDAAAVRVMEQELRDGFPLAFRDGIASMTRSRQQTLTAARDLAETTRGAPLARHVAAMLAIRRPVGGVTPSEVQDAVCVAVRAKAAACLREIDGHLALEAPRERAAAMARMRNALDKVDLTALGQTVAKGEDVQLTRFSKKPLTVDEDIS